MKQGTFPPDGYTVMVEEHSGARFYRAVRTVGPEWVSPFLWAVYESATRDAREHYAYEIAKGAPL